jgi:hypothetical protein
MNCERRWLIAAATCLALAVPGLAAAQTFTVKGFNDKGANVRAAAKSSHSARRRPPDQRRLSDGGRAGA